MSNRAKEVELECMTLQISLSMERTLVISAAVSPISGPLRTFCHLYDLIAKICPQNVPVYNLPAIDNNLSKRGLVVPFLAAIFRVGCFCAFRQRNRLLLLCRADGCAKRSLNSAVIGTQSLENHTPGPVELGNRPARFNPFVQSC